MSDGNINRKVQRESKELELIKRMGEDKYEWSYNIQKNPFPSWVEAFDYAYQLGLKRGSCQCTK